MRASNLPTFTLLGVRVHAVQIPDVIAWMEQRIAEQAAARFIAVTGMHSVMEAQHDPAFKQILNSAGLVVADGMPLVWSGRQRGYPMSRRVYGPELMDSFCRMTGPRYRHFLYGGAPGVAERLGEILHQRYGIRVVGTYSPPFRPLTQQEEKQVAEMVFEASPDILWVGLGTPKQERWMHEHTGKLRVPLMLGVGAAFDFQTGRLRQAPEWMRENGLEWLFRLGKEPKRLWRRYLVYGSQFICLASLELLGLRKFQGGIPDGLEDS